MNDYPVAGKRVLVTGGAGCLGSHVVDLLWDRGAHVDVLDDLSEGSVRNLRETWNPLHPGITWKGSLLGSEYLGAIFRSAQYDYVAHCAGHLLLKAQADPIAACQVNVMGTVQLLQAALEAGVKKLVFTSSISVFGEPEYLPVDEQHPFRNTTTYGATKLCGEMLCRDYGRRGLPFSIIRPYNIFGPRQSPKNGAFAQVVPKWIKALLAGEDITIHGDGSQTMDLVHVRDMALAHVLALEKKAADGEDFNVGTGVATNANSLARKLCRLLKVPETRIRYEPQHHKNHVSARRCDFRKATRLLGYQPGYDLETGLQETVQWWQAQQAQ